MALPRKSSPDQPILNTLSTPRPQTATAASLSLSLHLSCLPSSHTMIIRDVFYSYVEEVDPNLVRPSEYPQGWTRTDHLISSQTCAICQSALVDPVTTSSCKHTFCRDCITRALAHSPTCPIDRSALTLSSLRDTEPLVQLMLDELEVTCGAEGCGKVMQRGLLLSHIRTCARAIVTCGDDECGLSVRRLLWQWNAVDFDRWLGIVCRITVLTSASTDAWLAPSAAQQ